jgi:hypothetical protein
MPRFPLTAAALLSLVTLPARAAAPPADPIATDAEPTPVAEPPPPVTVTTPPGAPAFVAEPTPATETAPVTAARAPTPAPAIVAAPTRRERHGPALMVGLGIAYSVLGAQARYDIPVRRAVTVSPFVAGGLFGAGPFGVSTMLGGRHRLVVDLAVAPLGREQLYLHGTVVDGSRIYGPAAGVGYEHMSDGGWLQRATLEYAYEAWGSTALSHHYVIFGGFAFGRRIW